MRLIGVTVIILIVVVAIFLGSGGTGAAYYKTVEEVYSDSSLVGERVKVGGVVVAGSWDRQSNPMRFSIRDEKDEGDTGPAIKVVYDKGVPATFGDGVGAIVTGKLGEGHVITADDLLTKCPSKYESAEGAMPLDDLERNGQSMIGKHVKVTAFIKAGSVKPPGGDARFIATAKSDGGFEVPVAFENALPDGLKDGVQVILTGAFESDGVFVATDVALSK